MIISIPQSSTTNYTSSAAVIPRAKTSSQESNRSSTYTILLPAHGKQVLTSPVQEVVRPRSRGGTPSPCSPVKVMVAHGPKSTFSVQTTNTHEHPTYLSPVTGREPSHVHPPSGLLVERPCKDVVTTLLIRMCCSIPTRLMPLLLFALLELLLVRSLALPPFLHPLNPPPPLLLFLHLQL